MFGWHLVCILNQKTKHKTFCCTQVEEFDKEIARMKENQKSYLASLADTIGQYYTTGEMLSTKSDWSSNTTMKEMSQKSMLAKHAERMERIAATYQPGKKVKED